MGKDKKEKKAKKQEEAAVAVVEEKKEKKKKDKKRKAEAEAEAAPEKKKKSKKDKAEPAAEAAPEAAPKEKKDKKDKKRKREEEAAPAAAPAAEPAAEAMEEDADDVRAREVFMGGLSYSIEDKNVYDFFKDLGDKAVQKIRWLEKDGQFKGAGFITFTTKEQAAKACEKDGQELLGRNCKVNPAGQKPAAREPRAGGGGGGGNNDEKAERTMFCANCSNDIDDADIHEAWGADNIEQIRWLVRDDVFKGVGWVVFKDVAVAKEKLEEGGPAIKGRQLRLSLGPKREGDGPPAKRQRVGDDIPTDRKVKIANCAWKITDDDVKNVVSGIDKISWFERDGKFSGKGLLIFDTADNAKAAVDKSPLDIAGRETRFEAWTDAPAGGGGGGARFGGGGGGRPSKPSMKPTGNKMSFD
eukprot:NODE_941_length_1543_cov_546.632768_g930_i0.p2 GENE.NODE_941_length_1543_cov_546.632768_g930_i0~~NODE_941_length_1543_cov_546.632768_g930_i0.p2  ORF type:complete len:413 (+),score=174.07 NODE_941_length_1543_cov_546.632768_g930_i0:79-1317(+)